jgi:hypothetical protein
VTDSATKAYLRDPAVNPEVGDRLITPQGYHLRVVRVTPTHVEWEWNTPKKQGGWRLNSWTIGGWRNFVANGAKPE